LVLWLAGGWEELQPAANRAITGTNKRSFFIGYY
jgi:hypothetical protein